MRIGSLNPGERVLVVAEIGNNHEGDPDLAEALIGLAAAAGADAVKFQTFRTESFVSRSDADRFRRLKSFELAPQQFERLAGAARRAGVLFLSTPLDLDSARFLEPLVAAYKVASGDNTFMPLLETIAETGKPIIISTGLATFEEVARARRTVERVWRDLGVRQEVALLHCVSSYPTEARDANLAAIGTLKRAFECTVGYSDHTLGIEAAVLAVAAGARIVEKHFTIDKHLSDFRDHRLSADPDELAALVRRIRDVEAMLGDGTRTPRACERDVITALRRSAVAGRDLPAGTVLGPQDIAWVRPGGGIAPARASELIGRRLAGRVAAGERLDPRVLAPAPATEPACAGSP